MHASALRCGRSFFELYRQPSFRRVLDIGSLDVNGSLRSVCPADLEYVGIDLSAGRGVDVVLEDPYRYPFPDGHFDMIVSTSCFEHDRLFWETFLEGLRVLAPGGFFYVSAPANGFYHAHPLDCWRFYPDSGLALQHWASRCDVAVDLMESFTLERSDGDFWNDCVMIFRKAGGAGTTAPQRPLSAEIAALTNLRQLGQAELARAQPLPEDMRIISTQRVEIERLAARREAEAPPRPPSPSVPASSDTDGFWCHRGGNDGALAGALGLTICVVAYRRYDQLTCLLWSLQAQTSKDFHVVVMHDGPDYEMLRTLKRLAYELSISLEYRFSAVRHNDFGHSLRERAIAECGTRYLLLTNDDNYYTPKFVELMMGRAVAEDLDLVLCDMVHGHDNPGGRGTGTYSFFATQPSSYNADIGCFIVRAERAKRVGFRDKRSAGDGTFIDDLIALGPDLLRWGKIDKVLFVHN